MSSRTLTASEIYNLSSFYDGTPDDSTRHLGGFFRQQDQDHVNEILFRFNTDTTSLSDATVTGVSLRFSVDWSSAITQPQSVYLVQQNKVDPSDWPSPPVYNTFGTVLTTTPWDTTFSSVENVQAPGEYTIESSTGLVNYVQSWIDNTSNNWGLLLTREDGVGGQYVVIDSTIYLDIQYGTNRHYYSMLKLNPIPIDNLGSFVAGPVSPVTRTVTSDATFRSMDQFALDVKPNRHYDAMYKLLPWDVGPDTFEVDPDYIKDVYAETGDEDWTDQYSETTDTIKDKYTKG